MGLDFGVYWMKKSKGDFKNQLDAWHGDEFNLHELCYGRKSWELVYALNCDTQGDCITKLKKDKWINLMEKLSVVGPFLDEIDKAYQTIDCDNLNQFRYSHPREVQLIEAYEKWHDENFDENPTLGYEFSVGYMKNFWEQADNVLKYIEDPDYEVWMIASY